MWNKKGMVTTLVKAWLHMVMGCMAQGYGAVFGGVGVGSQTLKEGQPLFWPEHIGGSCRVVIGSQEC